MGYAEAIMAVAKYIMEENEKRQQAKNDKKVAKFIIAEICKKLDEIKKEILEGMRVLFETFKLEDLRGRFETLTTNVKEYDPDGSEDNKDLLRLIIDDRSADIMGQTKVVVQDNIVSRSDYALNAYPIYAMTVCVRAWAMIERKFTFNNNSDDDVLHMLDQHKNLSEMVILELTKRNKLRFGPVVMRRIDDKFWYGYDFRAANGTLEFQKKMNVTSEDGPLAPLYNLVVKQRDFHIENTLKDTISPINEYLLKLEDVKSTLGTELLVPPVRLKLNAKNIPIIAQDRQDDDGEVAGDEEVTSFSFRK